MRKGICGQIETELMKMIRNKAVHPGGRLPSERALAVRFKVSRNTIREAIRGLVEKGILTCRPNAGSYVTSGADDLVSQILKQSLEKKQVRLAEIFEIRRILEPAVAKKAAEKITPGELESLAVILDRQAEALERGRDPVPFDEKFHETLVRSAGNSVLWSVYATLNKILAETRSPEVQSRDRAALSVRSHTEILAALKESDGRAAARAMERHMDRMEKFATDGPSKDSIDNE
ncbi:MAG: FadR family transcriptional regulator [Desulfobacterales bacterium]|nr:FadR family transcriptional regulator [Desulfobacterales bacterium]